ncbi:tRNA (adenosine(37)-N6)-dimethylallyltransferase MiaA [Acholeplasma vituli]|uniref:tRNA dimethylallyltransferase n=1 Tax=Paracholeplasma vituli TaxID=69473 RepID=A0ABT2Q092_9MOLU|nr:tRNA (adenosine(37)-N6)-dimethylallyltransferase MiaA [Paracholeplasma vituli]MCU0105407.1 tRNA (adenosine(37)-N6)-dimethylallyltransferase MiaA [Paracholeplasma vituli]
MKKVVVICGPTAVGKTKLSIDLATYFDAEIISGDSVQVYQSLDIGSAKIKQEEMRGIKHHMLDILKPSESFDVATFQRLVRSHIETIERPFIVGGTGLYIKAALYDYEFNNPKRDLDEEKMYDNLSNEALHDLLKDIDPDTATILHPNNRRRVLRALSLAKETKRSSLQKKDVLIYDALILYASMDREILYERINKRVDMMMDESFLEETIKLKKEGLKLDILGYRELMQYLENELSLEDALIEIKKKTRHLAKRQETWFKNQMHAEIIDMKDYDSALALAIEKIKKFYEV